MDSRKPQKKRSRRSSRPARTAIIPLPQVPEGERPLKFSFKHLDTEHPKFHPKECSVEFHCALLDKVKEYSSWTVEAFCEANGNDRRHAIFFPDTTEKQGFALLADEQFADTECWQFCLQRDREWRVHGFVLEDTFYVVWLDEYHKLYGK